METVIQLLILKDLIQVDIKVLCNNHIMLMDKSLVIVQIITLNPILNILHLLILENKYILMLILIYWVYKIQLLKVILTHNLKVMYNHQVMHNLQVMDMAVLLQITEIWVILHSNISHNLILQVSL